jgi:predicted nucleotidyltransferase
MTNKNRFGLSDAVFAKIVNLIKEFSEIEQAHVFGSRALGTYHEGSDIDLATYGSKITPKTLRTFKISYDNLNLPYQLDVVHYDTIDNLEFKKHIDEHGVDIECSC